MSDTNTSAEARATASAGKVEATLLDLGAAMARYCARLKSEPPGFSMRQDDLSLRHAPRTPALGAVFHSQKPPSNCGISAAPAHLSARGALVMSSRHDELMGEASRGEMLDALTAFQHALCQIPLVAHDALQIDIAIRCGAPDADGFRLSIDGVALTANFTGLEALAAKAAGVVEGLALWDVPWGAARQFYVVQDHLVCAPGPGWALIKLHSLISGRRCPPTSLSAVLTKPPSVFRVEDLEAICRDCPGLGVG